MKSQKKNTYILAVNLLLISLPCCFTRSFSRRSQFRRKTLPPTFTVNGGTGIPSIAQTGPKTIYQNFLNELQNPLCETSNFQIGEIPTIITSSPHSIYIRNTESNLPLKCKSGPTSVSSYNSLKSINTVLSTNVFEKDRNMHSEFSSIANYRDILNFPEVEYPMTVQEMWKPNFWAAYDDYSNNNVNNDNYCIKQKNKSALSKNKPITNLGRKLKPSTQVVVQKDPHNERKNKIKLKNDKTEKIFDRSTVPIQENKLEKYFDKHSTKNIDDIESTSYNSYLEKRYKNETSVKEDNNNICFKNMEALEKSNMTQDVTSQSEILENIYSKKSSDKIISILNTIAAKINSNNVENSTPNEIPLHTMPVSNNNCDDLNVYNEFTSPNLTKNRRSQNFDDLINAMKDYEIPSMLNYDFESNLIDIDRLINSEAKRFNEDMTSIIQTRADKINNFNYLKENSISKNLDLRQNLDSYNERNKLKNNDEEFCYKPQKNLNDISSYADKFNQEMDLKLKSKADNIYLNQFETSDTLTSLQDIKSTEIVSPSRMKECELELARSQDFVNSYADRFNEAMTKKLLSADNNTNIFDNSVEKYTVDTTSTVDTVIDSYANRFHNEMLSVINSVEDKIKNMESSISKISDALLNDNIITVEPIYCQVDKYPKNVNYIERESFETAKPIESIHDTEMIPENDTDINKSDDTSKNMVNGYREVDIDEEYTTDIPEFEENYKESNLALSTVAPRTNELDLSQSNIIEYEKREYTDEFDQYFMLT